MSFQLRLDIVLFGIRVLVVAATLACAARADAMCAPQFWVGTPDGSTIPTSGSLYVFSNAYELTGDYPNRSHKRVPLSINWVGTPGTIQQSEVSTNVIKVSYRGPSGSQLIIGGSYDAARYQLADSWRRLATAPTVRKIEHDDSRGGCPSWNVLRVTLDQPTAALRIRWTFRDATSEWVLPANDELISIGHRSCGGSTVPEDQLDIGGHLELTAIGVDGSEVAVVGVPSTISFHDAPQGGDRAEIEATLLKLSRAETPRELPSDGIERIIISLVLLLASFGLAGWWQRRAIDRLR